MIINTCLLADDNYPNLLRQIPDTPKQFYWTGGDLSSLCNQPCVAIVGSRKVTPYGRLVTANLASELARLGVTIISGLAIGVDSIAHKSALDVGGKTIAVLPRGLDKIYPSCHANLANRIIDSGGVLMTEYPQGSELYNFQFLARNRIIAGLSLGVVVTEAAERSGSLNTANFALEQGREVLAVPGNITSPLSKGTNNLIKIGATPVDNAQDIIDNLNLSFELLKVNPADDLNDLEIILVSLIGEGIADSEALFARSGLDTSQFSQTLTLLELNGRIKNIGNNNWSL